MPDYIPPDSTPPDAAPVAARPAAARSAASLAAGSLLSGVLAYVVFALTTRELGPQAAAPVAVLWSYWGFAAAGLTFAVQHWIARTVTADGEEGGVRADLPRLGAVVAGLTVLTMLLAWLVREPLFGSAGTPFPVMVGLVTAGSGLMGLVRGLLAARGRFAEVGNVLVAENGLRLVVVAVLAGNDARDPAAYGWALVAGYAVCVAWPSAWIPARPSTPLPASGQAPGSTVLGFLGGASGGQVLGQVALVGPPVLLALLGGTPAQVTALFAVLALFRAPFVVLLGQVAQLTGFFTRLVVAGREERLRRLLRTIAGAAVLLTPLGAGFGALVGPGLVRIVFGGDVVVERVVAALIAGGSTLALVNLVASVLLFARARTAWVLGSWVAAMTVGAVAVLTLPGEAFGVSAWVFALVETTACVMLVLAARRAGRAGEGRAGERRSGEGRARESRAGQRRT